jgi:arsenite methyltransferase
MSSTHSALSEVRQPDWLWDFLGVDGPWDGSRQLGGQEFVVENGIPRQRSLLTKAQVQTEETFGFKWKKRDTFESAPARERVREWLFERYTDVANSEWLAEHGEQPILIDAGCGGGLSALELFPTMLGRIRYLGVDVSEAVDVAAARFAEAGQPGAFLQADISNLPLAPKSVDLIFSEGVLHHTDSTRNALTRLAKLLKPGGRFLFYVYKTKGPIREFTDDFIRARLQAMTPQEGWDAMTPLTRLGVALGELGVEVDIPEAIDLLDIPAGRMDIQRLFYWHVAKMFYHPDLSIEEMNHINYDWYAPANAARQSPEAVRAWCSEAGLTVEREVIEPAGITMIAKKTG